jgi:hypothetical protein
MARRLRGEEVMTIRVLAEKGQNHCEIARTLGVTEGAVRYRPRRPEPATDLVIRSDALQEIRLLNVHSSEKARLTFLAPPMILPVRTLRRCPWFGSPQPNCLPRDRS